MIQYSHVLLTFGGGDKIGSVFGSGLIGRGQGGRLPTQRLSTGKFVATNRENEARKKEKKMEKGQRKWGKIEKERVGKWKI